MSQGPPPRGGLLGRAIFLVAVAAAAAGAWFGMDYFAAIKLQMPSSP